MTSTLEQFEGLKAGTWTIDASHSEVGFTVRHLMSKVRGQFRTFEGTLTVADNPLESSVTATIDLSSVDTRNEQRDDHLRSNDFFSVENSSTMTFESTEIVDRDGELVARGNLTIKDVTKPIDLTLDYLGVGTDPWGGSRVGFEGSTSLSRKEWGIDFNIPLEGDKLMIGDKVNVVIAVEAVHQAVEVSSAA
jgi:polyisoprenoid-binding protein YceI